MGQDLDPHDIEVLKATSTLLLVWVAGIIFGAVVVTWQ